jgi:hypothetical protein
MINFFKRKEINAGDIYGIQTGDYVGELWVFVEEVGDTYHFLSMPKMKNREVTKEKFDFGKSNEIIEYVESAPRSYFKVVKRQFDENRNKLRSTKGLRPS